MFKIKTLKPKDGVNIVIKEVIEYEAIDYPAGTVFQTTKTRNDSNGSGTIIVRNTTPGNKETNIFDVLYLNPNDKHTKMSYGSNLEGYEFVLLSCTDNQALQMIKDQKLPLQLST